MTVDPPRPPSAVSPPGYHVCPGGCGELVGNARYACKPDWFRLPESLRRAIYSTVHARIGVRAGVLAQARTWYRNNPRPPAPGSVS